MVALLVLLTIHFIADFICQSDWMAQGKSKRWLPLVVHVTIYSMCFLPYGVLFVGVTFLTHGVTDFVTSRINRRLWEAKQTHWFFVGVGADQLIHAWTLGITYLWLI